MNITKNTLISEIIKKGPAKIFVLQSFGLHCITCSHASEEKLEDAAKIHNINLEDLLTQLNK